MKRYILFLWGVLGVFLSSYAQNVYTCRYWFDQNHSALQTESFTDSVWHGSIDVAHLTNGLHTLNLQVKDTSNRWNSPRSFMFIKMVGSVSDSSTGNYAYTCWFDQDYASAQTGLLTGGNILLDVDSLTNGVHTVNITLNRGGDYSSTRSYMFIKMTGGASESDSGNYAYTCWFDQDYASAQTGLLTSGNILLDVDSLTNGVHTVNITLNRGGDYSSTRSYMFIKMSGGTVDTNSGNYAYTCWFDQDYSRVQTGVLSSNNIMLDVDSLENGLHTVNIMLNRGNDYTSTRSYMFIKMSGGAVDTNSGNYAYTCWFDQDYSRVQTGVLSSNNIMLDVDSLENGLHTVNIMLNRGNDYTSTRSYMFMKAFSGSSSGSLITCSYWFDSDISNKQTIEFTNGNIMLDVEHLSEGIHFLNMIVTTQGTSTTYRHIFYKDFVGVRGIAKYEYWLNGDYANSRKHTVDPVRDTFNLVGLLPVDTLPIRPECFHFHPTDTTPIIYAKNEITFRFWSNDMRFIDTTRYYVDENVRMDVVADTLERDTTKFIAMPTNENIHWFKLEAGIGDSLTFKADHECVLELYSPSGERKYYSSATESKKFGGCHAWEDGIYYLAVHSGNESNTTHTTIYYDHISQFALLAYTPNVIGNKIGSRFIIDCIGNGLDSLTNVFITNSSDTIYMERIISNSISEARILFHIENIVSNGMYDLHLAFRYNEEFDTISMNNAIDFQEEFYDVEISISSPNESQRPYPVDIKIKNIGNVDRMYIPLNIAFNDPESISKVEFKNFYATMSLVADSIGYSFATLTDNLIGKNETGCVMFLYIPLLKAGEETILSLEFTAPDPHRIIDLYAWTGEGYDIGDFINILEEYSVSDTNSLINSTSVNQEEYIQYTSLFSMKNTKQARNMINFADALDNVSDYADDVEDLSNTVGAEVLGEAAGVVGSATSAGSMAIRTGVALSGIANGAMHVGDRMRLECYGIDPSDPLYDQIMNLRGMNRYPTPGEILGGDAGELLDRMHGIQRNCARQPNPQPESSYSMDFHTPGDPNEIYGYIAESNSKHIRKNVKELVYKIEFENDTNLATAPAHTIVVKDTLDSNLFDLTTFAAKSIAIGENVLNLNNEQNFIYTIDMRPNINVIAQIQLNYNVSTGVAVWTITSLDPATMEEVTDLYRGVLPINYDGSGMGRVSFSIQRKANLPDSAIITNKAYITFDYESAIATSTWVNILDTVSPVSSISHGEFVSDTVTFCFSGTDNNSGLWKYELHGRVDSISPWQLVSGNIYSQVFSDTVNSLLNDFYVIAIDSAGNRETKNPKAEYNRNTGLTDGNNSVTYQISFVNYDGSLLRTNTFASGIMPRYIGTLPTRTGDVRYTYAFRGWNPQLSTVSANATYTAVFDSIPNIYQITFVDKDSTVLQMDSLAYGATPEYVGTIQSLPPTDSFAYTFAGWNPSITPVSGDAIYVIKYDSMSITDMRYFLVTYNNWDGTELYRDSVLYGYTPTYRGENPTKENEYFSYQFVGWSPTVLPISGNATYTARFDSVAILYNIKFVNANGYVLQENEMQYGSIPAYTGDVPTLRSNNRYSYTFRGWNNVIDTVTANATYTAVYDSVIRDYIVRFVDYNGGILQSDTLHYGDTISYCGVAPQRASQAPCRYVFTGWSSERQIVEGNLDYIALYDSILFTIQCQTNDTAMGMAYSSAPQYGVPTVTLTAVANSCQYFSSWSDGNTDNPRIIELNRDTMLVAVFSETQPVETTIVAAICSGETYTDNGFNVSVAGTYTDTLQTINGCDSIVTLNLTINHSTTGVDVVSACDSYTWIDGVTYTASNNTATYTLTNAAGCDSVVTLNLTINNSSTTVDNVTACDSYTWIDGVTYTESTTTPTYTYTATNGCDSVVTLNLTINRSTSGIDVITACDSYTWIDGVTYTESNNTATYTLTNVAGCDSIVTLNLTINNSTTGTDVVTACDSYTWIDGVTYTESNNTATYTLTNAMGCDSIVTLNLTVNYAVYDTIVDTAMNEYTWNGTTYTESGVYEYADTTVAGCDSVVTLILTIQTVGVETADELETLAFYPNPTSGTITFNHTDIRKVEVMDGMGRMVAVVENSYHIDISQLAKGYYTMRITTSKGITIRRVVKQ